MEDIGKIKPYIAHLNRQLQQLRPQVDKLCSKPLDEQLLLLSDEREKLELTNRYAYVLSSLMFSYMKTINVKDMGPIMTELQRVKTYMNKARELDANDRKAHEKDSQDKQKAQKLLRTALKTGSTPTPAISKVHFEGKHTRFDDKGKVTKKHSKKR